MQCSVITCFSTSSVILDPLISSTLSVVLCSHRALASFIPPSLWNEFSAIRSVSSVVLEHSDSATLMIVVSPACHMTKGTRHMTKETRHMTKETSHMTSKYTSHDVK